MNFDFSEDQKLLQKQVQTLLKDHSGMEQVRKVMESGEPFDRELWKLLASGGWQGTAIPEEFGGSGLGYLELVLLAEELGASLAAVPFSSSVYFVTEAILLAGSNEQMEKYLPGLASGKFIGTFAWAEGAGVPGTTGLNTRFESDKLNGSKTPVIDGQAANLALVAAQEKGGTSLALVNLDGPGVTRERIESMDVTRSQSTIRFKDAPAERLGEAGKGEELLERLLDRAAVLLAFEQLGGAKQCHKMALDYAKERYAFGRPIGSFQAVKHKIVDMLVSVDLARSNCYYAAWALQNNEDLPVASAAARVSATEAFEFCSRENIQVHGGIGFTWEADPHIFFKRSKLLALMIGGPDLWRERLMRRLDDKHAA